ncbi:type II toxin-antitoxin system RelE/ParE family toxin [Undibacterium flavidum]|uniref:Type II toxin-antitoxin system RelE/ParE family toxin n=1 Tax=Undibacterium flavidum TaxID=2762297 RepID=A0ABR6YF28_9BURK|nr:type II toxin-antitoxin system RelE/ParE family toxin [Undibacterium flavidum]MBC3875175.1 type II toxin-antitoxin system RelE/ParE family toxin [Undibacterium flavidum]
MSYTVYVLDDAEEDLWQIHTYIKNQFSEKLANKIYTDIRNSILMLEDNPQLGTSIPQLAMLGMTQWRQMVVMGKNKIVYEIEENRQHIYVYLICTERQDYDAFLQRRIFRS